MLQEFEKRLNTTHAWLCCNEFDHGYGIDFNTSTCPKILGNNRFRDNTGGNVNGGGDWETATSRENITSDDADADDFVAAASDDYSLKAGAAATSKGVGYLIDIGAHGSPVVTAGGGLLTHSGMTGGING